mgnify:CR=1 FL=1
MLRSILFVLLFFVNAIAFGQDNLVAEIKIEGAKKTKPTFLKKLIKVKSLFVTPLKSLLTFIDFDSYFF